MATETARVELSSRALYFLLCYAADLYDPHDELLSGELDSCSPIDLPTLALSAAAATVLRRGARRVYRRSVYEGPAVRGRLDLGATMTLDLGRGAHAVSVVGELSPDCPQNRVIKTALSVVAACPGLAPKSRERAGAMKRAFPGSPYSTIAEARRALREVRLARGEAGYRRALFWAGLVLRSTMPDAGAYRLDDPLDDRRYLDRAFESLVRGALRESLDGVAIVRRDRFRWTPPDQYRSSLVPVMETDVTVRGPERCVVVDAKYYGQALVVGRHGSTQLRSSHLYQIASYLRVLRRRDSRHRLWSACLVYARSGESFDHRVDLGDFSLRALGLDLERPPREILDELAGVWSE